MVRHRLLQDVARLRQRSFGSVDQQQDGVDHVQAALDLSSEVGMARSVDDIEPDPLEFDGGLLRQDSDALLALQVAGIHDPLDDDLVGPERTRLTQHRVDQGGLAVVDMGDDGDVPDVGARRGLMHEPWIRC